MTEINETASTFDDLEPKGFLVLTFRELKGVVRSRAYRVEEMYLPDEEDIAFNVKRLTEMRKELKSLISAVVALQMLVEESLNRYTKKQE